MTGTEPGDQARAAPAPGATPPVGTLADETAQLLDAVAARLADYRSAPAVGPTAAADDNGRAHTCVGWCPICRSADLMRGDRTELTAKLLDTALLLVTTLRSLIPEPTTHADSATHESAAPRPSPQSGIERIDIR